MHATTCERPCWPGPWISTVDMKPTPQSLSAHSIPFESGVTIPASSLVTLSGTLWSTAFQGRYMYCAKPPHRWYGFSDDV